MRNYIIPASLHNSHVRAYYLHELYLARHNPQPDRDKAQRGLVKELLHFHRVQQWALRHPTASPFEFHWT